MPNKPKILVLGATGQVGKAVLPYLEADDKVEVMAAACLAQPEEHNGRTYRLGTRRRPITTSQEYSPRSLDNLFRMRRAHRKSSIGTSWQLAPNPPT
jgi:aspartate-semialdehyde dehydrogenase